MARNTEIEFRVSEIARMLLSWLVLLLLLLKLPALLVVRGHGNAKRDPSKLLSVEGVLWFRLDTWTDRQRALPNKEGVEEGGRAVTGRTPFGEKKKLIFITREMHMQLLFLFLSLHS